MFENDEEGPYVGYINKHSRLAKIQLQQPKQRRVNSNLSFDLSAIISEEPFFMATILHVITSMFAGSYHEVSGL